MENIGIQKVNADKFIKSDEYTKNGLRNANKFKRCIANIKIKIDSMGI